MIDDVLGRVEYDGDDLVHLTNYRPGLTCAPEKFFRVLDKIEEPGMQEIAVRWGVDNLFKAGRHDLVVPLVNALGKRTFKGKSLENAAIQRAFLEGAQIGNQGIVGFYYEHPAITSKEYACGLCDSWNGGEPNQVFQFLVEQADQGDLEKAKKQYVYVGYPKSRQAIGKALETAPPAGSRIITVEKVHSVLKVFASITGASEQVWTRQHHRGIFTR